MTQGTDKWVDQVLARTQAQDLKTLASGVAHVASGIEIDITQDDATIRTLLAGTKDIRGILESLMAKSGIAEVLDGNGAAGLWESKKRYETPTRNVIVAGTDMGIDYKPYNEDRVAVHTGTEFVAALDGVGGEGNAGDGLKAAQALAEAFRDHPTNVEEAVKAAQTEMQKQGVHPKAGVCFVSTRIHTDSSGKKSLEICQAGDASLILVDKQGSVKFASDDESLVTVLIKAGTISKDEALYHHMRNIVTNYIQPSRGSIKRYQPVEVESGDRVYLFSDGIGDNLTNEEIAVIGAGLPAEEAFHHISDITNQRMPRKDEMRKETQSGKREQEGKYSDGFRSEPKKDNRALVIVDIV